MTIFDDVKNIANNAEKEIKEVSEAAWKATGETVNKVGDFAEDVSKKITETAKPIIDTTTSTAKDVGEKIGEVDLFNNKLREKAVSEYNNTIEQYNNKANLLQMASCDLFTTRQNTLITIAKVEQHINDLANTPKTFDSTISEINIEVETFENKKKEIKKAEQEIKVTEGSTGIAATVGSLGIAVASLGPTAAMGIATTFGVASTGTAISTLSGAAAEAAATAWLGGGALAAGGGGVAAGNALLALAGPVGIAIAIAAGTVAVGSGIYASQKNKETSEKIAKEKIELEEVIRRYENMIQEIKQLIEITERQANEIEQLNKLVKGSDYLSFTDEEKKQAGFLVNSTLTLSKIINKEVDMYHE